MKVATFVPLETGGFELHLDTDGLVQLYGLWREGGKRWAEFQAGVQRVEAQRLSAESKKAAEEKLIIAQKKFEEECRVDFVCERPHETIPGAFLRLGKDLVLRQFTPLTIRSSYASSYDVYSHPHTHYFVAGGVEPVPFSAAPSWPADWLVLQFELGEKVHLRGHRVGCSVGLTTPSSALKNVTPGLVDAFRFSKDPRHCKHCITSTLR